MSKTGNWIERGFTWAMNLDWLWGKLVGKGLLSGAAAFLFAWVVQQVASISMWLLVSITCIFGAIVFTAISLGIPALKRRASSRRLFEQNALQVQLVHPIEQGIYARTSEVHGGLTQCEKEFGEWCVVLEISTALPVHKMPGVFASLQFVDHGKKALKVKRAMWIDAAFNAVDLEREPYSRRLVLAVHRNGRWYAVEDRRLSIDKKADPAVIPIEQQRIDVQVTVATVYGNRTYDIALQLELDMFSVHLLKG